MKILTVPHRQAGRRLERLSGPGSQGIRVHSHRVRARPARTGQDRGIAGGGAR